MRPHIFPKYRHIVVVGEKRFPTRITAETALTFETPVGLFLKSTGTKYGDRTVKFEGPFTAEGDMEARP